MDHEPAKRKYRELRRLITLATASSVLMMGGCESLPPIPLSEFMGRADNACMPEAILLTENFHQQGITAKVLLVTTRTYSHALVAFLYPATKPSVWVWDSNYGVIKLDAPFDDASAIAREWVHANQLDDSVVVAAFLQQ
jgi:hypothetical protein